MCCLLGLCVSGGRVWRVRSRGGDDHGDLGLEGEVLVKVIGIFSLGVSERDLRGGDARLGLFYSEQNQTAASMSEGDCSLLYRGVSCGYGIERAPSSETVTC